MKIRILGGGWYGCTIAASLLEDGHAVELHESASHLFAGASGANPARLHLGFHYPRSGLTQAACQEHQAEFMTRYGHLTRGITTNIYAVASDDSLVDYQSYLDSFRGRVEFVQIKPHEFGLKNVEGAVLTGERHIVIDDAREWFTDAIGDHVRFNVKPQDFDAALFEMTIDCTFCRQDEFGIDRFEPCVTAILKGPTDKAVTIMDGPFGSIYPWNESAGLLSLTSARFTPISKECRTWLEARRVLDAQTPDLLAIRGDKMMRQMQHYWPACVDLFKIVNYKLAVRAMPKSAADSRLVDVVRVDERTLRVRAGKIDAVFHAARMIRHGLADARSFMKAKMVM